MERFGTYPSSSFNGMLTLFFTRTYNWRRHPEQKAY